MGGQRGHTGQGGKLKEHPDTTLFYSLGDCPDCGQDLREVEVDEIIRKQIEDIPEIKTTPQTTVLLHQLKISLE